MNTVLIALCVFVALFFGAQIGVFAGYLLWGRAAKPVAPVEKEAPSAIEEELEQARKDREELIASQKAFQAMIGYNADIAYGIGESDFAGGS